MSIDPVIIIITLTSTLGPIIIALNKSIKSCNCFCFKCEKFDLQKDELQDEKKDENKNGTKSFFNKIIERVSPRRKKEKEKEIQSENLNLDYELNELNRLKDKVNELKNKNEKVYDLE